MKLTKQIENTERMVIDVQALLVSLIQEMDEKGMIDGKKVMNDYGEGFKKLIDDLRVK
jgi:soluble cytochrome b562